MSRMEDDDKGDGGRSEEGWHHGSGEVALFCLMLRQAIFKGKQVGDWKRVKTTREGGKERRMPSFFPLTPEKKKAEH